jgi:hypothetical protein
MLFIPVFIHCMLDYSFTNIKIELKIYKLDILSLHQSTKIQYNLMYV